MCSLLGFTSRDRFVGVPVIGTVGPIGILGVYWEEARAVDSANETELISAFADQAASPLTSASRS